MNYNELYDHLQMTACYLNVYSREYLNICRRLHWIIENRLK